MKEIKLTENKCKRNRKHTKLNENYANEETNLTSCAVILWTEKIVRQNCISNHIKKVMQKEEWKREKIIFKKYDILREKTEIVLYKRSELPFLFKYWCCPWYSAVI